MNIYHQEISSSLAGYIEEHHLVYKNAFHDRGTTKPLCYIPTADMRKIYKDFAHNHPSLSVGDLMDLLDSLSLSQTSNEFCAIGYLLEDFPRQRRDLDPVCLDRWLEHAEGWNEVDVICSPSFTAAELLADWPAWQVLLTQFVHSDNNHKRRASLVLLTRPLRESADPCLSNMAFCNIDLLRGEKAVLITKAVSWALRSLVNHHRAELEAYLDSNANLLPKIALRETRNKLEGGLKAKRSAALSK